MTTKTLGQIVYDALGRAQCKDEGLDYYFPWDGHDERAKAYWESAAQAVAAEVRKADAERAKALEAVANAAEAYLEVQGGLGDDEARNALCTALVGANAIRLGKHPDHAERDAVVQAALEFFEAYYAPLTDGDSGAYLRRVDPAWAALREAIAALRARREAKP